MRFAFLKHWPRWDVEEILIGSGLLSVFAGVWIRWDVGTALTMTGGLVLALGCVIAFGK